MRKHAFPIMGTVASLTVAPHVDELHDAAALRACRDSLTADEQRFSHFRSDSDISQWLAGSRISQEAYDEIQYILDGCTLLELTSNGVFKAMDPVTGHLDTAGLVKGYAIGKAVDAIWRVGVRDFTLNVGGDSYSSGRPSAERPWRVAIVDPVNEARIIGVVDATDMAVATSGPSQRGRHIWRGPEPAVDSGLRSFTAIGPDIAAADAYATIGFAMGEAGIEWVAARDDFRSFIVRSDGTVGGDATLVSAA